jgi:hypothetical protein
MFRKLQAQLNTLLAAMNTVSTDNSTTSTLGISGTYTGTWEDCSNFESIIVALATDQDCTIKIQFSPDGTNIDSTLTRYFRTNQIEPPHRFTITRQYYRIVIENGPTAQTYMRLQTMMSSNSADLNAPGDSTMSQDFDAIGVRPTDFHTEVALGRRQGHETWNKFGYNEDVDAASGEEIIASWGGTFQYLTAGETIDIVSTSVNDVNTTGTGAQRIIIYGVDENWKPQTEIVNMNGLTTVTTTSQWIGINRIAIYKAGTGLENAGTINVTANTSLYQMAQMPATQGTSQQCVFYVPEGHQFLAEWLHFDAIKTSGGSKPEITFKVYVYSDVATAQFEVFRDSLDIAIDNTLTIGPPIPFVVSEKSILWFVADTDTNDTAVRARFSGELVRDPDQTLT